MSKPSRAVPVALSIAAALFVASAARADEGRARKYIVQMEADPVASYQGGTAGLAATRPGRGQKIDRQNPDVARYASHLEQKQDQAARAVGAVKEYSYRYVFSGFSATLTPAQAEKLKSVPGVVGVFPDELRTLDTVTTPDFLGLTGRGGLWDQLGGPREAGEDVIVGIVDGGIWPESKSFADRDFDRSYRKHDRWKGECVAGEAFPASTCNDKLIGARYYSAGFGGFAEVKALFPYEVNSARDTDGHGTHTASTAAGNRGVRALYHGIDLGRTSGMAPRARVAAYKACWGRGGEPGAGCFNTDTVAAIDDAAADGVDVINFSISGSRTSFVDPVELAFLRAADAGVFVAASAGNSGPTASTVAHNSPWVTTVAAGTHDRLFAATATLGNGAEYLGASLGSGTGVLPMILSTAAGKAGADPTEVRLCFLGTLDPALVAGKMVVCDRGVNARVEKSQEVAAAGGLAMILANTSPNTLNADLHSVPTVHVDHLAGAAIRAYVAGTASPTGKLSAFSRQRILEAPFIAGFSSRGPPLASGDVLKPDIMAPGVDILASYSPANGGQDFEFLQGTSMSSPHIAGIAALLVGEHKHWTPAMIRSAIVTTASTVTNAGNPIPGGFFALGAGQVNPTSANDPGLVFDAGFLDWVGFLCGTGQITSASCAALRIDPANLNQPSIAVGALTGVRTVTRTVTSVGEHKETYACSASVPGFDATVAPATFSIREHGTQALSIRFTRTTAAFGAYAQGFLTCLGSRGHVLRSPVALRPQVLNAPAQVTGTGAPLSYGVTFGFDGAFTASSAGLVAATTAAGSVSTDPASSFAPGGPGTTSFTVTVPAGSVHARFALTDAATTAGSDLDLYVFRGTTQVGASAGGTSAELVDLRNPVAGDYTVWVHGFATANPSAFTLFSWVVGGDAGNMTVSAPATGSVGGTGTIGLSFTGLSPATSYLGAVVYGGGAAGARATLVQIDTP